MLETIAIIMLAYIVLRPQGRVPQGRYSRRA
jgi:hypothetical protein